MSAEIQDYYFRHFLLTVGLLVCSMAAGSAAEGSNSITPFFGMFKGESVTDPRGLLTTKDIDVGIWKTHQGFAINWHSVVVESGATKHASHEVRFERTHTSGIYRVYRVSDILGNAGLPVSTQGPPYHLSF